jgi:hypothetical protein
VVGIGIDPPPQQAYPRHQQDPPTRLRPETRVPLTAVDVPSNRTSMRAARRFGGVIGCTALRAVRRRSTG